MKARARGGEGGANASVAEQAAAWLMELSDEAPAAAVREAFFAWLRRSPRHIEEFLAVAMLEQELAGRAGDIEKILADVRRAAANAVPLDRSTLAQGSTQKRRRLRTRLGWASAAAAVIAAVLLALAGDRPRPPVLHETAFGEQRDVVLADGSIVTLDTRSSLSVYFDRGTRRVFLLRGQAMFDVARDEKKPFIVESGDLALNVLGTRFSVRRRTDAVEVVVVDGTVAATSQRSLGRPVFLKAGEGAVAAAGSPIRRTPVNMEKALAWTERRLIFDEAELAEVVAEFNRYNRVPLVIEDAELARRTVTTVFNAHDSSALVGFLDLVPGIEVEYGSDAIRIRSAQ